jgi:cell division protein DivIC
MEKIESVSDKKKPWYAFLKSKFFIISVLFIIWMLFLDNYCYFNAQKDLNTELEALENQKKYYKTEIYNDQKNIKELKDPAQIERYAREKYYMKKDGEDVYVIEFEGDSLNKKL